MADSTTTPPVRRIDCVNGRATGITLASGETHSADVVVFNGDTAALSDGLLGADVSTSVPVRPPPSTWTFCDYVVHQRRDIRL